MKRFLLAAVFGLLGQASAHAQTAGFAAAAIAIGQNVPGRVQVQMSIEQRVTSNSPDDQQRAQESGRRLLYQMAAHECVLLSDIFKSDCKISMLNVNTNINERDEGPYWVNGSASVQYQLVPRQQ